MNIFCYTDEPFSIPFALSEVKKLLKHTHESNLEVWMKCHPCLSWSYLLSILLRKKENDAAKYIFQNYRIEGYCNFVICVCFMILLLCVFAWFYCMCLYDFVMCVYFGLQVFNSCSESKLVGAIILPACKA